MSNVIINEPSRVIMDSQIGDGSTGDWVEEIILDVAYSGTAHIDEFNEQFEFMGKRFLGDPHESWYQGIDFTAVIRRKSDNWLFGYSYWEDISKHGSSYVEPNGEENGHEATYDEDYNYVTGPFYVWFPVKPFTIIGFEVRDD